MNINKILESAILAPSGDNCQPWRLMIKDNQVSILNLPEKDKSLFNFRQRASLIAHGALIENIMIASSPLGYNARLKTFPDAINPNLIASIELEKSDAVEEPLYPYIPQRATNRKSYKPIDLADEQKLTLLNVPKFLGTGELKLLDGEDKRILAKAIGINDRLVFGNRYLHEFLFEHIRWTEEEAVNTRDGLYIKTLELSAQQEIGFRLLKKWGLVKTLNKLGLLEVIARQAEKLFLSAAAAGAVVVDGNSSEDFLAGGRLVQRIWLEATRMGLSFQPMTGITFLIQRVLDREAEGLSEKEVKLLMDAYEMIRSILRIKNETIVMIFRIGISDPPTARSLRLPLERVLYYA